MFYFAYGRNLNHAEMRRRCPKAKPLGRFTLADARLVFRRVADVEYAEGEKVVGGLWKITPDCERMLDAYEGIGGGFYRKEYARVVKGGRKGDRVMYYVMNSKGIAPPYASYLADLEKGYRDFKLPMSQLRAALLHSWENKRPTFVERQRDRRKGRPAVAARPSVARTGLPTTGNQLALPLEGDA